MIECYLCGKPKCSAGFLFCSACDHQLKRELGENWQKEEWAREYISSMRKERYHDDKYYARKVDYDDCGGQNDSLCIVDMNTKLGRPRLKTPDDTIKSLIDRGHGYKAVFRILTQDGYKASLSTIKRRVNDLRK
jgi:uncharacterized Zn finger protein (UPF0148 family)